MIITKMPFLELVFGDKLRLFAFLTLVAGVFSELEAALSSLVLQGCLFLLSFTLSFCYVSLLACNAEQDKCYVTLTVWTNWFHSHYLPYYLFLIILN